MKLNSFKLLAVLLLTSFTIPVAAQTQKKASSKQTVTKQPASFIISKTEFDQLFTKKSNAILTTKSNKYLDKSTVLMNTLNGDTKFLKIKLHYFAKAYLIVQVNGEYSTQVFILSDDKSVFYKGRLDKGILTMTKCNEDDIVSE